jgi:hypothetical protein
MNPRHGIYFVRSFGPRWIAWRAGYELSKRSGLMKRRYPATPLADVPLGAVLHPEVPVDPAAYRVHRARQSGRFFFDAGQLPDRAVLRQVVGEHGIERTISVADRYAGGHFLFYSRIEQDLGQPVNWLLNPFTGYVHHTRSHWCDYQTFSTSAGDIKDVWEASRFACAFWLARAYALTGDEKYPQVFWDLFESWCAQNPVNMGSNWKCGQETALRCMAWCFALHVFWDAGATTDERVAAMVRMLAISGERIARNIGYAVSQKNNHAFSEATGLITLGLVFPEMRGAQRWLRIGRQVLEREIGRQVYADGSYVQQSMNYHRVMLHNCLWAQRLLELNGQPLAEEARRRVALAGEFLLHMLDVDSGRVPNYGYNDGALIFPLSACDYLDYRPTIQAERQLSTGLPALGPGPWNEMPLWFFGTSALTAEPSGARPASRQFPVGGYYTLRSQDSWCMIRCFTYTDRPAHVDMLHVDLWWRGVNLLGDSGTYRYFVPDEPAMERYFKDMMAHNAVEIGGRGPLDLLHRWMWLAWPKAKTFECGSTHWKGEHYGYARAPWQAVCRRTVQVRGADGWLVTDEVMGEGRQPLVLRWHLADLPCHTDTERRQVEIEVPSGTATISIDGPEELRLELHRGMQNRERVCGWQSLYYGERTPRPTLAVSGTIKLPVSIRTQIRLMGKATS